MGAQGGEHGENEARPRGPTGGKPVTRSKAWLIPLVLALGALAGGWFGPFGPVSAADNDPSTVEDSLRSFTKAYALVEENFADPLTAERSIYRGAIPGML